MTRPRRARRHAPVGLDQLEHRRLLAGPPTAVWVGQVLQDLAGGSAPGAGNGVQDVRVALSGLSADRRISTVDVLGYGGGEWVVNIGPYTRFNAALVRSEGSTTADLFLDPYQSETGREFTVRLGYDDGGSDTINLIGGTADANLRMPTAAVRAGWVGQDGRDLTGPTAAVGPDGYMDVHFSIAGLFPGTAVRSVTVVGTTGAGWSAGLNPLVMNNAEFFRNAADPTRGDLYFSPDSDLGGKTLAVTVVYADDKVDQTTLTAQPTDPALSMSWPAAPTLEWGLVQVAWLGQDGLWLSGRGDVHLAVSGIPAGRTVAAAMLSNQAGVAWYQARPGSGLSTTDPNVRPLGFRAGAGPDRIDLGFGPVRDETGAMLTLVLTLDDGRLLASRFAGGPCDPGLRAVGPAATTVVAHPGDDLNDLAARFGHIRLVAGVYPMDRPLVLGAPVEIRAAPGTTLVFAQGPNDPAWTAAIKVLVSHVTLDGFAVRFAGPVRWASNISYGPAVVGSLDNYDAWVPDPRLDLTFTNLDLQVPPPTTAWEEAPRLFRLNTAESGRIADNVLRGGTTEVFGGPWVISGNDYRGTPPGTFAYDAFAMRFTHDVTLIGNHASPAGPSGKTWRFLVQTGGGVGDTVLNNTVEGIGMRDDDTVANPNCPELVLTESYRLHYEGTVASVSADGRVARIFEPQGGPARTGDVLAVLSGPQAGQWRLVAQALGPSTYLLDSPITPGRFAVSLATGFVGETYQGNTIDASASTGADLLVLAGNHYGTRVVGNQLIGGRRAFRITAVPTEQPGDWGWSHAPFLGATVAGNTVRDSLLGGQLDVERNGYTKSATGRVYFSGAFQSNTGVWSQAFLDRRAGLNPGMPPRLVTVGNGLIADPGELVLSASDNRVDGPAGLVSSPTLQVVAGTLDGQRVRNLGVVLPAVTAGSNPPPGSVGGSASGAVHVKPADAPDPLGEEPPSAPAPAVVPAPSPPARLVPVGWHRRWDRFPRPGTAAPVIRRTGPGLPGGRAQRSLRTFWVISRSQTLHHFQRLAPTASSRCDLAIETVRNQILTSPSDALSSLAQRAKWSRFVPAFAAAFLPFPLDSAR